MPKKIESPQGAEIGYLYDLYRQGINRKIEKAKKAKKLKRKIDYLSAKNRVLKRK